MREVEQRDDLLKAFLKVLEDLEDQLEKETEEDEALAASAFQEKERKQEQAKIKEENS